jgi:transposase-like protein
VRISDRLKMRIVKMLHFTELNYSEISRSVGVRREVVYKVAKETRDDKPLTDEELACTNVTQGFMNYLARNYDGR